MAGTLVVVIAVVFSLIAFGPFYAVRWPRIDAFIPAYATAMFVCDCITAILLYAQFSIVRSRAIILVASGYLFTALILIPFVLVFPGVFTPERGLLGGPQSTSWVWCLWHAGFPMFMTGYALLKDADASRRSLPSTAARQIAASVALTATLVAMIGFLFIVGEPLLPRVASGSLHFSPLWPYFIGAPVALANLLALVVLWSRRQSMLDLWLLVVIFLYLVEVFLSYYPDPNRFSVAWYTVRVIGFLASALVLVVLLYEITTVYARMLGAVVGQRREREARLMTGDAVAATIAHEVRQPLTAMITSADAGLRFLGRDTPNLERAKAAFDRIVTDGHRAGAVIESIRANFRNDTRTTTSVNVNELIQDVLASQRGALEKHRIVVRSESAERPLEARANRVQLQQVLLNLVVNAIDAMEVNDGPRILSVTCEPYDTTHVSIAIADTGAGISAQNADRIFNPLFTTKADGMGMGLSICRAIIEAHEGQLWFAPNTPRGATFRFTLRAEPPPASVEA
jgi:signal transduction histidine kinase